MLKLKLQYFGHLMRRVDSLEKTLMLGGIAGRRKKGTTEDEMARWHHRLDGHGLEQALGVGTTEDEIARWHHRLDGHGLEQALGVGEG